MEPEGRRWEDLGTDCLVRVFERLGPEDLALGAGLVCKPWYKASLSPQCWKVLDFRALDFMPWSKFVRRFMHDYGLQRFSFTGYMKFTIGHSQRSATDLIFPQGSIANLEDLVYAANECPRLKVLVLPNLTPQAEEHVPALFEKWKDLRWLEMASKPSCFRQMLRQINLCCKGFTTLKMSGSISEEDASAIVSLAPKLTGLCLSNSFLRREELLVIMDGCKELETLEVVKCIGFNVDDEIRRRASRIKRFECEGSKLCFDSSDNDDHDDIIVM